MPGHDVFDNPGIGRPGEHVHGGIVGQLRPDGAEKLIEQPAELRLVEPVPRLRPHLRVRRIGQQQVGRFGQLRHDCAAVAAVQRYGFVPVKRGDFLPGAVRSGAGGSGAAANSSGRGELCFHRVLSGCYFLIASVRAFSAATSSALPAIDFSCLGLSDMPAGVSWV